MLNEVLRALRIISDIKQNVMASELDISCPHLCQIESGQRGASIDLLQKYCAVFGIKMSKLMAMVEEVEKIPEDTDKRKAFRVMAYTLIMALDGKKGSY